MLLITFNLGLAPNLVCCKPQTQTFWSLISSVKDLSGLTNCAL